jgi:RecA-family ATPase
MSVTDDQFERLSKGFAVANAKEQLRTILKGKNSDIHEKKSKFFEWCEIRETSLDSFDAQNIWESEVDESIEQRKTESEEDEVVVYTWDEINKFTFPEDPWRINKLLPLEGFVILAGVSGEGKSFVSLEMANAITTPRPFVDEPQFDVKGTNVLYIDGEMSKSELQRRGRQMGFADARKHKLFFVSQNEVNLSSDERDDLGDVMRIVEEEDIGVVFVDTLRAVAGGIEENKAEEVRRFFNRFKPLKDAGVCVVFLDHLRKGFGPKQSEPQKDNLLASQDKTASCEGLIMLQKKSGEGTIAVFQRKNRLGPEMEPFDIAMYDTDMDSKKNRIRLEYFGVHDGHESKLENAKELILDELSQSDRTRKELIKVVQDAMDVGERTIQSALKTLHKNKQVEVTNENRQHRYSLKKPETP